MASMRSLWLAPGALLLLLLCLLFACSSSLDSLTPLSVTAAKLPDCCCDLETIDLGNDAVMYNRLQKLRVSASSSQRACTGAKRDSSAPQLREGKLHAHAHFVPAVLRVARCCVRPSRSFESSRSTCTASARSGKTTRSAIEGIAPCAMNVAKMMSVQRGATLQSAEGGEARLEDSFSVFASV
jgi:hypothetical protein